MLRIFDPCLCLREIGRRLIGEFTGLRGQRIVEKPADANQKREQREIDEQRPNGTRHSYALQLRHERANRFTQGNREKYQEHGAERVREYENRRQRDQCDACREPEGALRERDDEAAWWDAAGCGSDGYGYRGR